MAVSKIERSKAVVVFRWIVLAAAAFYWAQQWLLVDFDQFGWQFQYLTIWGLTFSLICAFLMLFRSLGKNAPRYDGVASMTAVINVMVVYLYWSIYFDDPSAVNGGDPIPWWRDLYLHLGVQVLQWIDLFFFLGAFRKPLRTLLFVGGVTCAYALWMEAALVHLNDEPVGTEVSGLPYPFLNDMTLAERLQFDAITVVTALVVALILWGLSAGLRRARLLP